MKLSKKAAKKRKDVREWIAKTVEKEWVFEIYQFDKKTLEINFKERSRTKPMTEVYLRTLLAKRMKTYDGPVCFKIGAW